MAIGMLVRKENHETIVTGEASWDPPRLLLSQGNLPLLSGIDGYANTIFNTWQCRLHLPYEVAFLQRNRDARQGAMFDELERLVEVTGKGLHLYLWFVGD